MPVTIAQGSSITRHKIDQTKPTPQKHGLISLGTFQFDADVPVRVTISTEGAGGICHADAVQFLELK